MEKAHQKPNPMHLAIRYLLQPFLIVFVLAAWWFYADFVGIYIILIIGVQLLLGILEYLMPARKDWVQSATEKTRNVGITLVIITLTIMVAIYYAEVFSGPLQSFREGTVLDIWPHEWPLIAQALLAFFMSEMLWYWMHRAEHTFAIFWRLSGHGAHHSFKRLGAINFGANHPIEVLFIALPSAMIELIFGVGLAAAGAAVLLSTQASIAHTNLNLNSKFIGWFFTTNEYHIHHHSVILKESNTNYGCAAIIWDRVFGTFEAGKTLETGTGPTEPTLWQKFLMPIKEPNDTSTAPS